MGAAFTAECVRRARQRRGISGRTLASEAGLSTSAVSKVESGQHDLSLRTFARLAKALRLTPLEVWVVVVGEGRE